MNLLCIQVLVLQLVPDINIFFQSLTSLVAQLVKRLAYNVGDLGSIPGLGRSPRDRNGSPLQYSGLENPMNGGAWWATVHGVTKSQTRLSNFTLLFTFYLFHITFCLVFVLTTPPSCGILLP